MVNLGDKVTDQITGFSGVAIGITEWLYGCRRIAVLSQKLKDGTPKEEQWFDEQRLTKTPKATTGGLKLEANIRHTDPRR